MSDAEQVSCRRDWRELCAGTGAGAVPRRADGYAATEPELIGRGVLSHIRRTGPPLASTDRRHRECVRPVSSTSASVPTGIGVHYARYLGANVLVTAAGFVSFPFMTRLLDNHQFGVLGYYEAWLLLLAGVLKLGTQHAILRFYPHNGGRDALLRFRSDHLLLPFALSLMLWLTCAGAAWLLIEYVADGERPVLWLMLLMVPLTIWCSFVEAVMFAMERSDITLWLKSAWRWGELGLVLLTILLIERSAVGVFAARLVVLLIVATWLGWWLRRWLRGSLTRPRRDAWLAGLAFGLPMMANELLQVVFGLGDRVLLRVLTGDFAIVGIYTIGYGLAMAVAAVLGQTLAQAFTPTAVRLFETRGPAAVVELKRDMLDVWIVGIAIVSALLLTGGEELLLVLAGPSKAASAPVFVWVALIVVWYSLFEIAQYGLVLQKRPLRFMLNSLYATLFNLALNVPLIVHYGVIGAVVATAVSYVLLVLLQVWHCPRELRYLPPAWRFAVAVLFPLSMWWLFRQVEPLLELSTLPRMLLGSAMVMLFAVPLVWFDTDLQRRAREFLALRREAGGAR